MKETLQTSQTLGQTQTLAPLQVQFVRMLEMNGAAIEDEVQRRLDENPALEVVDDDRAGDDRIASESNETSDIDDDSYGDEDYSAGPTGLTTRGSAPIDINASDDDMASLLHAQIGELDIDARTAALAGYIVDSLDDNGWLTRPLSALARDISDLLGTYLTASDLQEAFDVVRRLDPPGIGAVDLRDCLLLQLDRKPRTLPVLTAREIINDHFELFKMRHFDKLRTKLGIDNQLLQEAVDEIRSLNPKPGNSQTSPMAMHAMHVSPDFLVETDDEGRITVTLNEHVPELVLSKTFDPQTIKDLGTEVSKARAFVRNRAREANEFIDLIRRRSQTLLDIMQAIAVRQAEFFATDDVLAIKPMILKDIADATGRDVSVVSRATSGKYVATARGVYPVKMLFNESTRDDTDQSARSVMHELRKMIDNEDKKKPYSDDALVELLTQKGFEVARRTVAKYREQMGVPNSRGRRGV